jgi:monodechloroaminopyrrolnitrin synthase
LTDAVDQNLILQSERVSMGDPLRVDDAWPRLWAMSQRADVDGVVALLRHALPTAAQVSAFSLEECVAAMRDLGLFLGSIKRHGVEPVDAVPEVEPILLDLGARTDMVPRDTVYHYVSWNPVGPRERTYTGQPMERQLISAVRVCLPNLATAVETGRKLVELAPDDVDFAANARELTRLLCCMEESIDTAIREVTPAFFALTMRPYFEEIRVGGTTYLGPAAAHVPLSLIDLLLWASDHCDEEYESFWRESVQFGPPLWRRLYLSWAGSPSLVSRVIQSVRRSPADHVPPQLRDSVDAVCGSLRALIVFRGKHLTLARKAYDEEIRQYPLGSGGGSTDLLRQICLLTRDNANLIRHSFGSARPVSSGARQRPAVA